MNDNLRRYIAIYQSLKSLYPTEPTGNLIRRLKTLAALISGIVGSKSTNFPKIAEYVSDDSKAESRIKKISSFYAK